MQVFINECSLNNQFKDTNSFLQSVRIFLSSIQLIVQLKDKEVFRADSFFYYTGISDVHFQTSLKSDPNLNRIFFENLQMVNPKNWDRIHDEAASYIYEKRDYVGTSVAEITERKKVLPQWIGFLLNFTESQFSNHVKINVVKNDLDKIEVDCAYDPDSINTWLIDNGLKNPDEIYDEKSKLAPADIQTVLRDNNTFELTHYKRNNGRKVYRRIGTEELWVVDSASKHAGPGAHIEIFNERTQEHLGTSLYNKIQLDTDYKVDNRKIDLGN